MRNKLLILVLIGILISSVFSYEMADAKKSSAKGGITQEDMDAMSKSVDDLTKKTYSNGLFSPEDNGNLIDIKIKLDNQMLVASDPALAPLYYKVAMLYKSRDMKDEAVECFQTILENFADTALAPKATAQLKTLGVEVKAPTTPAGGEATPAK